MKATEILDQIKDELRGIETSRLHGLTSRLEDQLQGADIEKDEDHPDFNWRETDEIEPYAVLLSYVELSLIDSHELEWIDKHLPSIASTASQRLQAIYDKFNKVVWNYEFHLEQDARAELDAKRTPMTDEERRAFDFKFAADMVNSAARHCPDIAEELKAVLEKIRPQEPREPKV